MPKIAVLELNELNFEYVRLYAGRGHLPNFDRFLTLHGYSETTSEVSYAELEPWIQWVTVHTGKSFAEHGLFRLGDAVGTSTPQIWERIERELNLCVGAISPMNAANRASRPAFFLPDPWTPTHASGSWLLRQLSGALAQAVNDNATGRLTIPTLATLALGILRYARFRNYKAYLVLAARSLSQGWNKVSFLDLFLSDLFVCLNRETEPDFSTLFLNGAAHLQHHYLFNCSAVTSDQVNPAWYVDAKADPVLDIYKTYDRILGSVIDALPNYRLLLITGLHQDPYPTTKFYWRLRDHAAFLRHLRLSFREVQPRMSRDFEILFDRREDVEVAAETLKSARINGATVFNVADRGERLFVELTYPAEIVKGMTLLSKRGAVHDFNTQVAFVALKNGHHSSIGYLSDGGRRADEMPKSIPLTSVSDTIMALLRDRAPSTVRKRQLDPLPA